ncbi:Lcl3p [Sporobolomyces koalae]|uniref:Lcl3p n=1 Tax=Sporobolomyces koalae TaxID=500713 RepID=UPI0031829597
MLPKAVTPPLHEPTEVGFIERISDPTSARFWSPANPIVIGVGTSLLIVGSYSAWMRFGRRIATVDDLRRCDFAPRRRLRGVVTSVGDADNFRLWHRPLLRRFATVPATRSELKGETIHVRLAGVDAPELAHFGKPAQPFSSEALDLLTKTVLGKAVTVELHQRDRYSRVVGMAYVRSFPWIRRQNVSEVLLKAGLATVYRQAGAVHAGRLSEFERLEATARAKRIGMWSLRSTDYESPADYKRRTAKV